MQYKRQIPLHEEEETIDWTGLTIRNENHFALLFLLCRKGQIMEGLANNVFQPDLN